MKLWGVRRPLEEVNAERWRRSPGVISSWRWPCARLTGGERPAWGSPGWLALLPMAGPGAASGRLRQAPLQQKGAHP